MKTVYLVVSGDLRLSADQNCWATQEAVEKPVFAAVERAVQLLSSLPGISRENAEEPMRLLAEEMGLKAGQLFGILRVAVTGQTVSPPLFESMEVIGKEKVMRRLHAA